MCPRIADSRITGRRASRDAEAEPRPAPAVPEEALPAGAAVAAAGILATVTRVGLRVPAKAAGMRLLSLSWVGLSPKVVQYRSAEQIVGILPLKTGIGLADLCTADPG